MFQNMGGDQLIRDLPMNAKGKIKFFRKCCANLEPVTEFSGYGISLSEKALSTLDERNWCVHGVALFSVSKTIAENIPLIRHVKPELASTEAKIVTLDDIRGTRFDCLDLLCSFSLFLYQPLGVLSKEHVDNVFRELGFEAGA